MGSKKYYKNLDLIRLISCIAVLLYHLNIIKGGYLAVCTFFALTGYLSCISALKKEKFSIVEYYKNRLKHIYLPLLIVVFISIVAISFFKDINWLNLKPETTSVLFGYNNFWQINASLDYFARHINSPFMHFWYIAILMQFDLVFPFIFLIFNKLAKKNKSITCVLLIIISTILSIYFYIKSLNGDILSSYYNTFTRLFSIFFGITTAFIHYYIRPLCLVKNKNIIKTLFYSLIIILIILFICVDAKSNYYQICMIITSLISCKLIEYSVLLYGEENILDKIVKSLSQMSYEIYLIQYPVIFIVQSLELGDLSVFIVITITILLSYILHFALSKKDKLRVIKYILSIILLLISIYGIYLYIISKDHTEEMKALENELLENERLMEERQKEYALKLEQEEKEWQQKMQDLDSISDSLEESIAKLRVVGVGDSVMLGALDELYKKFPSGYFDAKKSRTAWVANDILIDLKNKGLLKEPIIFGLGANGDCPETCKNEILSTIGDRKLFWVNATNDNDVHVNKGFNDFAKKHGNVYIIDWETISKGHPEYFVADKVHLTEIGVIKYSEAIYNSIYKVYRDEFEEEKNKILTERENIQKKKATLFGNDLLLNSFKFVKDDFKDDSIKINDYTFESLKEEIQKEIDNNTLNYKVAFVFDNSFKISENEYKELIDLCKEHEIYIYSYNKINQVDFITIIDLNEKIENLEELFLPDKIHLNDIGNEKVSELLKLIKQ